jgi:hexosaminidase
VLTHSSNLACVELIMRIAHAVLVMGLIFSSQTILAAPLPRTSVPDAFVAKPFETVIPTPQDAKFQDGTLGIDGLGIKLEGNAQELQNAARDILNETQIRLGRKLEVGTSGKLIRIGTLENASLASDAKAKGVTPDKKEGYGLWVDSSGAGVIGFDALGAYRGAQTLRQLLTKDGFRFAQIRDWPGIANRMAMIYLDQNSKGINDLIVPLLGKLKFSQVLVMSNYVQWDASKGFAHPGGASKPEAKRIADLIRAYGMEPIPLLETLGHTQWLFYGGQNKDLMQDPDSKDPFAYDTLNERTYQVLLPILSEIVETFKPKFMHIGHDEVRNRDRFPARENGIAVGFEKLFVDDTVRLHDHLKSLNVGTMIWHDVALSDAFREKILPVLPKDIVITNWHYETNSDYPSLRLARDAGFPVIGSSWFATGNPEAMARAVAKDHLFGALQTRWTGYFGNSSMFDGQAQQGIAYLSAGDAFWNPTATQAPAADASKASDPLNGTPLISPGVPLTRGTVVAGGPVPIELASRYRDAYQPGPFKAQAGSLVDLSSLVTRQLADNDETQWIQKGSSIDLSSLPTGVQRLGAYQFNISGAIMLKGARPAASELPASLTLEIGSKVSGIAFLHTCGWSSPVTSPRSKIGAYTITYDDNSIVTIPLEYGRNITAWTDLVARSVIQDPVWRGKTKEDLEVGINVLSWKNPNPGKIVKQIQLVSDGLQSNPTLIGLTLIE